MRQPLQSEPPQIGPTSRVPGSGAQSVPRSVDTATLDLLSVWQRDDATSDLAQLKAAEEELAVFMKAVKPADPLFRFVRNGKVGYIDSSGKVVIQPTLQKAGTSGGEFHEGLVAIEDDKGYRYVE